MFLWNFLRGGGENFLVEKGKSEGVTGGSYLKFPLW